MIITSIRHFLTRIGELATHPAAFAIVLIYALTWLIVSPATFGWYGAATGATLFMTMLTAFVTLLHRTTGQEDIPIGVPVANRSQSVIEGLVGTFVNTLINNFVVFMLAGSSFASVSG